MMLYVTIFERNQYLALGLQAVLEDILTYPDVSCRVYICPGNWPSAVYFIAQQGQVTGLSTLHYPSTSFGGSKQHRGSILPLDRVQLEHMVLHLLGGNSYVPRMTAAQKRVFHYVVLGLTSRQIAVRTGSHYKTVCSHKQCLKQKLACRNSRALYMWQLCFSACHCNPNAILNTQVQFTSVTSILSDYQTRYMSRKAVRRMS